MNHYIAWLHDLGMADLDRVGGKNASLGEMISQLSNLGVTVPGGFATTAQAFRDYLAQSGLDRRIDARLQALDERGEDIGDHLFDHHQNEITLRRRLMPAMLTRDERVIRQDCLCYLMERIRTPD